MYLFDRALELLRLGTGNPSAQFHPGQAEAIRHLVENRGRLLVIQKTGWGKSFVYFTAAKLLREQGAGPTLLVSPLLALMRNQLAAAQRMGLNAFTIHSDNRKEWDEVEERVAQNQVDILLISPERLANERFQEQVLAKISDRIPLLVIDEAHCLSDWGHDFRPHYRLIERVVRGMAGGPRLLATTATANQRVQSDLQDILGKDLTVLRGDLNRPSLVLQTLLLPHQTQRLAWLADNLSRLPGSGIIYTLTVRDAYQVARWLQSQGLAVEAYTADSGDRRPQLEDALMNNQVKALVATTALGMGYDKPDLGFVVHYQTPGSVVAYYQQVGRAGRALEVAYGILLSGSEEQAINDFFIENAFPLEENVATILSLLETGPHTLDQLQEAINLRPSVIEKALELLALESPAPVVKQGATWHRTHVPLQPAFWERARRLTRQRREEQQQMQRYTRLTAGHMDFLIQALDGPKSLEPTNSAPSLPVAVDPTSVTQAATFLRHAELEILPRKMWPAGSSIAPKRNIPSEHRAEVGRALSAWRDGGWGEQVYQGKYRDGHFPDELVEATSQLMKRWNPQPSPLWVTCIPSQKRPQLVPSFAARLAERLGLPFHPVLAKTEDRPEQKTMCNSHQQMANVQGPLALTQPVPVGPVLLVDDVVDSRWTLTVAAWLLRSHEAGQVFPLVLAVAGGDS